MKEHFSLLITALKDGLLTNIKQYSYLFIAALKESPLAAFFVSATWLQTFVETSMPVLQLLLAFAGLVFTIYQIRIKRRELMQMSTDKSEYAPNDPTSVT